MLGFAFGTLCFIGLTGLLLGPRCHGRHHGHHGHHGPPRGAGGGRRRRGRFQKGGRFGRAASEMFKRRLDLDEDQSDLIDHALLDLRQAMKGLRGELLDGREDLAKAFKGDTVDEASLAALFSNQDEEITRFRREAVSALKQIHAVLEPEQRELAVSWLTRDQGRW